MTRLSVLDQSIAVTGRSHADSIRESLALAQFCERLGYSRFWVSEHHNHETIAGSAPEILMAAVAATTSTIRIGSAGVMLPHYSALKVAEQFKTLEALAPSRIDLGVGRAPGSDGRTAFALNPDAASRAEQFPQQVKELMAWTAGEPLQEGHPFRRVRAHPETETAPEIWVLGTSDYGAQVAGLLGLPYCFAHFITDGAGAEQAISLYRSVFRPSARLPEPIASVCVWALAADSEDEAQYQFTPRAYARLLRDRGVRQPIDRPDAAPPYAFSVLDERAMEDLRRTHMVGAVDKVAVQLRDLADSLNIDELVILTWAHDVAVRERSYELLAQAFGLSAATTTAAAE
ncbi:MAG: LLM class flavin-dependent oxidoreductase [Hyphomicrobiaceae bacterium]